MDTHIVSGVIDWIAAYPWVALVGVFAVALLLLVVALAVSTSRGLAAIQADVVAAKALQLRQQAAEAANLQEPPSEQQQWNSSEIARVRAIPGRKLQQSLDELLEIEESLLGLRELYARKLIPLDVYARESLKVGSRLKV